MATEDINNESQKKHIRFKHDLIAKIDTSVEREKEANPKANFSAWVIDACERKLDSEKAEK